MSRALFASVLLVGCYSSYGADDAPTDDISDDRPGFDGGVRDMRIPRFDGDLPPLDLAFADFGARDIGPVPDMGAPRDAGPPPDLAFDDAATRDSGVPPRRDAGPRPDLGSSDAAVGLDAGPPPDPTGCAHRNPPALDADGLRVEEYWTFGSQSNANSTPVVADLDTTDSDPRPSVVWTRSNFAETSGNLSFARPDDVNPSSVGLIEVDPTANPALVDLDGGGRLEIVALRPRAGLLAVRPNGVELWRTDLPSEMDRSDEGGTARGGVVTVADLEGDGSVEVIVGKHIFDGATGTRRPVAATGDRGIHAAIGPMGCVGDVDRDGVQEVIVGGTAYGASGAVEWDSPTVPDGLCAIGEVSASAGLEVVVVADGQLYVLEGSSGMVLEQRPLLGTPSAGLGGGAPALADVDADGLMEIAVAHGDRVAVYDFDCPASAPCTDDLRWAAEHIDPARTAGVSFGDLNGDGEWELFSLDRFSLYVREGLTGELVTARAMASVSILQAPIVSDLDLDGDAELVVPSSRLAAGGVYVERPRPGIQVIGKANGAWTGARTIWNQHAYHITNVTDSGEQAGGAIRSFRTQSVGPSPLALPNLVGSATVECRPGGEALIRVSVLNAGLAPAGDFEVELTRGVRDIPVTVVGVPGPLNPGERADVAIFEQWRPPMQVYVDRRRDGNVFECNERDNRVDLPMLDCR